jgi:DNA-binding FadR family transcriptional regulator
MATRIPTYRQAQIDIKTYIERNGLKPGDALPAEDRFAEEIGVSRLSLREALKALDSVGIVETRHGEGVFVKAFSFDSILENLPYAMAMTDAQVRNLLYARAYLELGAIPDVVMHIEPQQIRRMRELAGIMLERAGCGQAAPEEDHAFHVEMYRCLDNEFLNSLIDLFWRAFNKMNSNAQPEPIPQWALESGARDHMQVVEMLEQRDTFGLLSSHRRHFNNLFSRYPRNPPSAATLAGHKTEGMEA